MNKKMSIGLLMGLCLICPSIFVLIAMIFLGGSGGTPADFQLLTVSTIASLFSGIGIFLLAFEAIELRAFIEEELKIMKEKVRKND
jgi:hypothetical protein